MTKNIDQKEIMDPIIFEQNILSILKDKESGFRNFIKEIRELIEEKYGLLDNTIGIFGSYRNILPTLEGDMKGLEIINNLSRDFAENGLIAITGEHISFKKDGKICHESFLQDKIKNNFLSSPESLSDFSRCLASISNSAIFLLSQNRSSSQKEEEEFLRNKFEENRFCVGILFLQKDPEGCIELKTEKDYYNCSNKDFKKCRNNKCPFQEYGFIPAGDMELFVKTSFSNLIILKSSEIIVPIVLNLKNKLLPIN